MIRRFYPENRLSQYVGVGEGVTVRGAIESAEVELNTLKEVVVGAIDVKVSMLQGLAAKLNGGGGESFAPDIHRLANDIFCDAGVLDFDDLSAAAFQLCDLISHWRNGAPLNPEAVLVHVNAIALLADPRDALGSPERAAILAGLKRVYAKFADVPVANQNKPA